ncbi:MAG: CDC27 family protein [Holophagae bacterium]|jgi:tetratricopeptide (TPR) repeat protein
MKNNIRRTVIGVALIAAVVLAGPAAAEWNKGLEAYKAKDYSTAAKEFQEVTETNPDYVGGYYMLGLCQRAQNNLSAAIGNLRKAVDLDSAGDAPDPRYSIALAQALIQAKQHNEAYAALKKFSFSSLPSSYRTSYALLFANAANETNRSGEAVNVLNAQIKADSRNAGLYQALGVAENELGDDKAAYAAFKRAWELDSSDQATGRYAVRSAIATARRSSSAGEKNRYYTEAAQIAEKLAAANPTFEHNLYAGEAWLGAKQYSKALGWFDKARTQQSRNALVHYYIGQCYSSLDKYSDALSSLQKALSLGSGDADLRKKIYNQMGYVHEKNRDFIKAKQAYLEAGNTRQAAAMDDKEAAKAGNIEHERQCREFKNKIDALALQAEEFEKLGDMDSAKQMREQLSVLQRQYAETCS